MSYYPARPRDGTIAPFWWDIFPGFPDKPKPEDSDSLRVWMGGRIVRMSREELKEFHLVQALRAEVRMTERRETLRRLKSMAGAIFVGALLGLGLNVCRDHEIATGCYTMLVIFWFHYRLIRSAKGGDPSAAVR